MKREQRWDGKKFVRDGRWREMCWDAERWVTASAWQVTQRERILDLTMDEAIALVCRHFRFRRSKPAAKEYRALQIVITAALVEQP